MERIDAIDFKTRCLAILEHVAATGESVVILKRGEPVVELRPAVVSRAAYPQYEFKASVVEVGDIVEPAVPANHWEALATALRDHGANNEVADAKASAHGVLYCVDGTIQTPDGRHPQARTIRLVEEATTAPRLITAYPLRRDHV